MKLIIGIDDDVYKKIVADKYAIYDKMFYSIKNGTPIPDNATNGDVMRIIFPKIGLYDEWYDEPYQKGGK